jgi:hypothetical protein
MSLDNGSELFSACLPIGNNIYTFGVRRSQDGARYLMVSQDPSAGAPAGRVLVPEAYLEAFCEALRSVAGYLGALPVEPAGAQAEPPAKTYTVAGIRQRHARAYEPWSAAEDERLRQRRGEGADLVALATEFQRKPSAIRSRLMRLGLS